MKLRIITLIGLVTSATLCGTTRAQIFQTNINHNTIGEYTTSGATVNASLVTGLHQPQDIALSGGNLFVTNGGFPGTIGEYTTSGATVNPALVSLLDTGGGIAVVSGSVPEASSSLTLLLLGAIATFGLKSLLCRPA